MSLPNQFSSVLDSASNMLVVPILPVRANIPYQPILTGYPHSPKQSSFLFAFHSPQANQPALTSSPGIGHLSQHSDYLLPEK